MIHHEERHVTLADGPRENFQPSDITEREEYFRSLMEYTAETPHQISNLGTSIAVKEQRRKLRGSEGKVLEDHQAMHLAPAPASVALALLHSLSTSYQTTTGFEPHLQRYTRPQTIRQNPLLTAPGVFLSETEPSGYSSKL